MQPYTQPLLERALADAAMARSSQAEFSRWNLTAAGHRAMTYRGKRFVSYRMFFGEPEKLNTFTMIDCMIDLDLGILSHWEDQDGAPFYLDHAPKEVAEGCFMWHPHKSSFEFTKLRTGEMSLRMPVHLRTTNHPGHYAEGCTYLVEQGVFDDVVRAKQ